MDNKKYRVLFFDSGIGGLSVYQETMKHNDIIPSYLFDNLHFPYGIQPDDVVIETVVKLLKNFTERYLTDLIVIACNTASTVALQYVRENVRIPVVGVVPAVKPAAQISVNKVIGLLATPATVRRPYTMELIDRFASDCMVLKIGSSELVEIAERKMMGLPYDRKIIGQVLREWCEGNLVPDTVVLGCTHFPHLRKEIQEVLPYAKLIDSEDAIARRVGYLLKELQNNHIPSVEMENSDNIITLNEAVAFCTDGSKITSCLQQGFSGFGFKRVEVFKV